MKIILLIISVLLILFSLLNEGKSGGLSAFTGNNDLGLFQNIKSRGPEKVISTITLVLGILFMVLVVIIKVTE